MGELYHGLQFPAIVNVGRGGSLFRNSLDGAELPAPRPVNAALQPDLSKRAIAQLSLPLPRFVHSDSSLSGRGARSVVYVLSLTIKEASVQPRVTDQIRCEPAHCASRTLVRNSRMAICGRTFAHWSSGRMLRKMAFPYSKLLSTLLLGRHARGVGPGRLICCFGVQAARQPNDGVQFLTRSG